VTAARSLRGAFGWVERIGLAAVTLKLCAQLYLGILAGRARLDLPALAAALRQSGLSVLPALTLVAAAVGVILGRQAAQLLDAVDLPGLILVPVFYAIVVELIPLLVGILVAGRAGVALAARQAMLVASGQVDGLLVCGLNPIQYTAGPVLLAMLAMSLAFVVWGSLVTFAAVAAWMVLLAGVPLAELTDALRRALEPGDLLQALLKPLVFALAVALIATVNGTVAGRDVEGIGGAATATMIGAVTAILLIDLGFVLAPWF
jgi:phospholipid/cholesterol/gamma-HCH transport system permease protein